MVQANVAEACLAILAGSRYHTIPADYRPRWVLAVRLHEQLKGYVGVAGRRPEPANPVAECPVPPAACPQAGDRRQAHPMADEARKGMVDRALLPEARLADSTSGFRRRPAS